MPGDDIKPLDLVEEKKKDKKLVPFKATEFYKKENKKDKVKFIDITKSDTSDSEEDKNKEISIMKQLDENIIEEEKEVSK